MAKHETPVAEKATVEQLLARVEELEAREQNHWDVIQNFLAKFGTYYNTEGVGAFFIVDRFTNGGVNGVAITPQQGLVEQFGLLIKTKRPELQTERPCFVPEIIPELKIVSESDDGGDNPQAVS